MAILVVSMHDEMLYAERALRAGARGYVMKQVAAKTITLAAQRVLNGKIWLSDEIREDLVNRIARSNAAASPTDSFHALSDREATVFGLIGTGMKKGEIAKELNLSPHTVETYRSNIKQKMGLASGTELYRSAFLRSQEMPPLPTKCSSPPQDQNTLSDSPESSLHRAAVPEQASSARTTRAQHPLSRRHFPR